MKKRMLMGFVLLTGTLCLNAQSTYKSGIGVRVGSGNYDVIAGSFKTFIIPEKGAIELNFGVRPDNSNYINNENSLNIFNVSFSASYQHHFPIANIEGFKWFVGGGATVYNSFSNYKAYRGFGVGLFPTGGVEYKFNKIPLAVSADFRPTFSIVDPYDVSPYNAFYVGNTGLGVRYTFR